MDEKDLILTGLGAIGSAMFTVAGWLHLRINSAEKQLRADHIRETAAIWDAVGSIQQGTAVFRECVARQLGELSNLPTQVQGISEKLDRLIERRRDTIGTGNG